MSTIRIDDYFKRHGIEPPPESLVRYIETEDEFTRVLYVVEVPRMNRAALVAIWGGVAVAGIGFGWWVCHIVMAALRVWRAV